MSCQTLKEIENKLKALHMDATLQINEAKATNIYVGQAERQFMLTGNSKNQYGEPFTKLGNGAIFVHRSIAAKFLYYAQEGAEYVKK